MDRRQFMGVLGITIFSVVSLPCVTKKRGRLVWEGSDCASFVHPETLDYVATFQGTLIFLAKPRHKYIRFRAVNPNARVTFACGGHMFLGYALGRDDILNLEGFDWKRYQKRLANTKECAWA